jgi:hypothetical protein
MFSLLFLVVIKVFSIKFESSRVPLWIEEELESFVHFWLVILSAWIKIAMFLFYYSRGCNICEMILYECYINNLHATTCNRMLGHLSHSRFGPHGKREVPLSIFTPQYSSGRCWRPAAATGSQRPPPSFSPCSVSRPTTVLHPPTFSAPRHVALERGENSAVWGKRKGRQIGWGRDDAGWGRRGEDAGIGRDEEAADWGARGGLGTTRGGLGFHRGQKK